MIVPPTQGTVASADSLREVLDTVFAQPQYQWIERTNPLAFLLRWWRRVIEWLAGLESSQPVIYWLLFYGMLAVLVVIIIHAVFVMVRTLRAAQAPADSTAVPEARTRGAAWYRREALRLAAAGQYPEAMQADFLGLVLELDARQLLRFHPSKTPNEYTREIRLSDTGRDRFRGLVGSLYGYAFARVPCGPAEFAAWHGSAQSEGYATPV